MNENSGFLEGLNVSEAREKIIGELKEKDLLVRQKETMHRTPICERSKDPIEFIAMKEFYLKQLDFKEEMRSIAKKLNFFALKSRQILLNWIDSISTDWPISRRRYYGTEIPLWYCKKCNEVIVPPTGKYYQPWKEKPPVKECPKCKGTEFRGEERVFDTWFDSSNSPLYILGYVRNQKFFDKNKPCTLRPQGKEIVRTWLYYTLLKGKLLLDESIFRDVWINYHIVDENGIKMSKSKGNVIDPQEVLDKFGAEPFRLWAVVEGNLEKTDFRCSFDRIQGSAKTLTKLWNIARFISSFEKKQSKDMEFWAEDRWILKELNELIKYVKKRYEKYDFHNPAVRIKTFLWNDFASHYLEMAKSRAYNSEGVFKGEDQQAALYTLEYCLSTILKLLAPLVPFITYILYKKIYETDIHFTKFPEPKKAFEFDVGFETQELIELNSHIWKHKKSKGLSLNKPLKEMKIAKKWKLLEKGLKATHHIENIIYV